MACKHIESFELQPPKPNQAVYREDCTQCFDSIDDPTGLDVCLYCFNGGCTGERNHSQVHYASTQHPVILNIRRTKRVIVRDEPRQKMSKLAIAAETDADRFDIRQVVRCYECGIDDVDTTSTLIASVVDKVMKANTFSRQEEVKAWEQEITSCEHILTLSQEPERTIESQDLGHCSMCSLQNNLWLCLQCGNLGCGRAQFGGVGGQSHGLAHADASHHAVAVKLGSITPEGTADVYCYHCDEERVDEDLGSHLAHWGIILAERQKTEKSLTEMQIEQNLRWEFSMTTEDGKELKPLFGRGLTGLKNLGNSCYLASTFQCLFSLPQFQTRYFHPEGDLPLVQDPAQDLETQLQKIADGLLSGRYSRPDSDVVTSEFSAEVPSQRGLAPSMLKHLVGRGHAEFSTMRQQDAFEFLLHLFKLISRSRHPSGLRDPTDAFRFVMEQRLQCLACKRVRYRTEEQDNISVPLPVRKDARQSSQSEPSDSMGEYEPVTFKDCLDSFTAEEVVELTCVSCGSKGGFTKRSLFKTFPEVLAVNARRIMQVNWVPTKVDVPVLVGDEPITLDDYRSLGKQAAEELMPDDNKDIQPSFTANQEALTILEQMGFPIGRCEKALHATGNSDANAAMEWLFSHMDDPDIDKPLVIQSTLQTVVSVDVDKLESLCNMGFTKDHARKALNETTGDMERAVDWLFSHPDNQGDVDEDTQTSDTDRPIEIPWSKALPARFELQSIICHKGNSIHAGHYVAFIRRQLDTDKTKSWVLFNDEKVVKAENVDEVKKFAYVYFLERL